MIRGLHYQLNKPQGKFISVLKGEILDVVVDLRKKSKTFGKQFKTILSEKNCRSIFIPEGFAHGFSCFGKENMKYYSSFDTLPRQKGYGIVFLKNKEINLEKFKKINWSSVAFLSTNSAYNIRSSQIENEFTE